MSNFIDKTKRKVARSKFYRSISYFWHWKNNISKLKYLLFVYFLIIVLSSIILFLPISQNANQPKISYINAVFTTASAFSDTGLVVVDTYKHWNDLGQAVIAILILSGGIGIFALKFFIINYLFGKKTTSVVEMKLLQTERGGSDMSKMIKLIVSSVKFIFIVICFYSIILTLYFYFSPLKHTKGIQLMLNGDFISPQYNWGLSLKFGIFHTISAINNAGFDIMSGFSLMPYYQNYFLQISFIILLIIGGVGYPVLYDLLEWIKHKIHRKPTQYKFSLFTKVSLTAYLLILIAGFLASIVFETTSSNPYTLWNQYYIPENLSDSVYTTYTKWFNDGADLTNVPDKIKQYVENGHLYGSDFDKFFAVVFSSFSTRSAGFATVNIKHFTQGTTFIFILMMIIGAAPASTGGGIRTTTFALMFMSIVRILFGWPKVRMFKRSIRQETVNMSSQIIAITLIIILLASMILFSSFDTYKGQIKTDSIFNNGNEVFGTENIVFEVASAFGTTGLSSGITKNLNVASKITLILVMFIGQFGISSTLQVWKRKKSYKRTFEYIDGDIAIG
ncbi:TrkH family potassium uptake protein [Mycoplasma nasistruthionis]|uniref:TrkH family potassium uptake protein n=1 Tax=Mycoplasma nasistruthionis TaxID=353852 RepID=UPI001FE849A5|nr:potassium transporter TrkG [Mycoplasma nasistruthionis]